MAARVVTLLDLDVPPLPPVYCLGNCGKRLWDPKSRELGYGPDCAEKLGIIPSASPRFTRKAGGDCAGQVDLLEATVSEFITTEASDYYHAEECPAFQAGRRGSDAAGYRSHEIRRVSAAQAESQRKKPCPTCVTT